MNNKKLSWKQVLQKFDEFEEKFSTNPSDNSLPEFFETFGQIINDGEYNTEQLKEIRERMLNLREIFTKEKESLAERSNEALDRHRNVSQYVKTSHIKNNR